MKVLTIGTLKGGTGKTTLAFNLGGMLAEKFKVLFIDLDPQGNLSQNVGLNLMDKNLRTVKDIFTVNTDNEGNVIDADPSDLIRKCPIADLPKLDIIPASKDLDNTEIEIESRMNREMILGNYIHNHSDVFQNYDYIMIDTRPTFGVLNRNAFLAADKILAVTDMGQNGIDGCKDLAMKWKIALAGSGWDNQIHALVMNKYEQKTLVSHDLVEWVTKTSEYWKPLTCKTPIRRTVRFVNAEMASLPIHLAAKHPELVPYDALCRGAIEDLKAVAQELYEKGVL